MGASSSSAFSGRLGYFLAIVASVIAGFALAAQARINGELGLALDNGPLAALVSFGSGLVILTVAMTVWKPGRGGLRHLREAIRVGEVPAWVILAGASGAYFVMTQGVVAGVIGVALFTVAVVTGQTLTAVLIDSRGLLGVRPIRLTPMRAVGSIVVLFGVVTATSILSGDVAALRWQILLPLIAGMLTGWQQAINGRVRMAARSVLTASFLNFLVGTVVLTIIVLVLLPVQGLPSQWPTAPWLYLGGALGAGFIAVQSATVHRIGILALGVSLVTGQVVSALLLDWLAPVHGNEVTSWALIGSGLVVAGSVMVTLGRSSRSDR